MTRAVELDRFSGERISGLVCVDRLVLRAVVLENTLDLLRPGDHPDIQHYQSDPQHTVDDHKRKRGIRDEILEVVRRKRREQDEQRQRDHHRKHHRPEHLTLGQLLLFLSAGLDRRPGERLEPELERFDENQDAADEWDTPPSGLTAQLGKVVALRDDRAVGTTAGNSPLIRSAHHHALHDGLAANTCSRRAGQLATPSTCRSRLIPWPCARYRRQPWRSGAGTARRGHRSRRGSAYPYRRDGWRSRSPAWQADRSRRQSTRSSRWSGWLTCVRKAKSDDVS